MHARSHTHSLTHSLKIAKRRGASRAPLQLSTPLPVTTHARGGPITRSVTRDPHLWAERPKPSSTGPCTHPTGWLIEIRR